MENNQNLTRVAVGGAAWLLIGGLAIQLFSLVAQIVLGWLLTKGDFGLYALAIGVTECVQVFRDGGVSLWLARKTRNDFDEQVGQSFWLCAVSSFLIAVGLMLMAPVAARIYSEPMVGWMIFMVAMSVPLEAYGVIVETDLQVALRFRGLAIYRAISPMFRYGLVILLAWRGWGPLSFVLPLIPLAVVRILHGYALTRFNPLRTAANYHQMKGIFDESRWVFTGTFSSSIFRQIDYLVLGLIASTATVGVYFFAFQLAVQPVLLLSQSLRRVLIPTFSLAGNDPARRTRAVVRAGAVIGLVGSGLFLLFALMAGVIESVLWRGRWESAVPAMGWLAAAMPMQLLALLARMIAQSDGQFRLWGGVVIVRSIGLALTVLAAAVTSHEQPTIIAAAVAVYFALSSVMEAAFILRRLEISLQPVLAVVVPPYLFALAAAGACRYLATVVPWTSDGADIHVWPAILSACLFVGAFSIGTFVSFRSNLDHVLSLRKSITKS